MVLSVAMGDGQLEMGTILGKVLREKCMSGSGGDHTTSHDGPDVLESHWAAGVLGPVLYTESRT